MDCKPVEFCKYHNCGAPCKLGESYDADDFEFHFCKDDPCMILNEKAYDKVVD